VLIHRLVLIRVREGREITFTFAYAVTRPSVVCLDVTFLHPTQPVEIFGNSQYFYAIWYRGHPLTYLKNFTEIVAGEPLRQGSRNAVASDGTWMKLAV